MIKKILNSTSAQHIEVDRPKREENKLLSGTVMENVMS